MSGGRAARAAAPGGPVRVLHLITGLGVGGAEVMLHKLARGSDRRAFRHEVVSMTPEGPIADRLRADGVPVRSLGMRRGVPSLRALAALARAVRAERPDVLQGWMYHGNLLASAVGARTGVPVLWNIRSAGQGRHLVCWASRFAAGQPELVLVNSERGLAYHAGIGYRPRGWRVVPNGFDFEEFRPDPAARAAVRAELGVAPGAPLVGMFARLDPVKDHAGFLTAAARVRAERPDARFLLVGTDVTADNPSVAALVRAHGLDASSHLLGRRADVARLMAACDVVVSPSRYEGFSNVLGEALGCGVPCVVTDVGDSAAIVGDAGRVVPPGDPEALARATLAILGLDGEARAALSARARATAVERFGLPAVVRRYEEVYRAVVAARTAGRRVATATEVPC